MDTQNLGISEETTDPAQIIEFLPIVISGDMTEYTPIKTLLLIVVVYSLISFLK